MKKKLVLIWLLILLAAFLLWPSVKYGETIRTCPDNPLAGNCAPIYKAEIAEISGGYNYLKVNLDGDTLTPGPSYDFRGEKAKLIKSAPVVEGLSDPAEDLYFRLDQAIIGSFVISTVLTFASYFILKKPIAKRTKPSK
jgi:hypothetical protein